MTGNQAILLLTIPMWGWILYNLVAFIAELIALTYRERKNILPGLKSAVIKIITSLWENKAGIYKTVAIALFALAWILYVNGNPR